MLLSNTENAPTAPHGRPLLNRPQARNPLTLTLPIRSIKHGLLLSDTEDLITLPSHRSPPHGAQPRSEPGEPLTLALPARAVEHGLHLRDAEGVCAGLRGGGLQTGDPITRAPFARPVEHAALLCDAGRARAGVVACAVVEFGVVHGYRLPRAADRWASRWIDFAFRYGLAGTCSRDGVPDRRGVGWAFCGCNANRFFVLGVGGRRGEGPLADAFLLDRVPDGGFFDGAACC